MIKKQKTALVIAAVIMIATGPVVVQAWFQAANAVQSPAEQAINLEALAPDQRRALADIVVKARLVWCRPAVGTGITNFHPKCHPVGKGGL